MSAKPTHRDALAYRPAVAARVIGVSERTLHSWRMTGDGPPFLKRGRVILYTRAALERWLDSQLDEMGVSNGDQ